MTELELKFALPASLHDALERDPDLGPWRSEQVWSCYHDTPDGALAQARTAVRVRRKGEAWLQTVKADLGDAFERFEWERPITGPTPSLDALPAADTPAGALTRRTFDAWQPLFETDFERRSTVVQNGALRIEMARDTGEVRGKVGNEARVAAIREVELELLEGPQPAYFDWVRDWVIKHDARLLIATKNERGLRLCERLPARPQPVPAGPLEQFDPLAPQALKAAVSLVCRNLEAARADIEDQAGIVARAAESGEAGKHAAGNTALAANPRRDGIQALHEALVRCRLILAARHGAAHADAALSRQAAGLARLAAAATGAPLLAAAEPAHPEGSPAAQQQALHVHALLSLHAALNGPPLTRFVLEALAGSSRHPDDTQT
jgi:hypothetical protein